jgi:hypothetical protein
VWWPGYIVSRLSQHIVAVYIVHLHLGHVSVVYKLLETITSVIVAIEEQKPLTTFIHLYRQQHGPYLPPYNNILQIN